MNIDTIKPTVDTIARITLILGIVPIYTKPSHGKRNQHTVTWIKEKAYVVVYDDFERFVLCEGNVPEDVVKNLKEVASKYDHSFNHDEDYDEDDLFDQEYYENTLPFKRIN